MQMPNSCPARLPEDSSSAGMTTEAMEPGSIVLRDGNDLVIARSRAATCRSARRRDAHNRGPGCRSRVRAFRRRPAAGRMRATAASTSLPAFRWPDSTAIRIRSARPGSTIGVQPWLTRSVLTSSGRCRKRGGRHAPDRRRTRRRRSRGRKSTTSCMYRSRLHMLNSARIQLGTFSNSIRRWWAVP